MVTTTDHFVSRRSGRKRPAVRRPALALFKPGERKLADHLRLFVAAVTDYAIFTLSPAGNVTSWNAGARRIKGYLAEEILGQHFSRFYAPEDREADLPGQALRQAEHSGSFSAEGWRVRKDGSRFWASVVIEPVHDDAGKLLGFAKVTRDLTERKAAAAALDRAHLALFQSQKLEALGQLTGGVAHDFNNLLAVIVNGIGLLGREVQSPAGRRVLASMESAATRGARLIDQLLAFARRQPLKPSPHDLNDLIVAFESILRRTRPESIALQLQLQPDLPQVLIDPTQFEAALLNLLTNARDAMPAGGIVTLSTGHRVLGESAVGQLAPGHYVCVSIADTGVGMAPAVLDRAIEPFYTTKSAGHGTGLGLSQVYGLSQQSGGELQIESQPDKGTTVTIWLPVVPGTEASVEPGDRVREKALVVDDNAEVLDVAAELFRGMGYDVLTAIDGQAALETLAVTPDLAVLFSDIAMPRLDGLSLAEQARQQRPNLDIILASGFPLPVHGPELMRFKFIPKPYRLSDLLRTLERKGLVKR